MASRKQTPSNKTQENRAEDAVTEAFEDANMAAAEAALMDAQDFAPSDFEHAQAQVQSQQAQVPHFEITPVTLLQGAIFPARNMAERSPNAPEMTGTLQIDDLSLRVPVAGFVTTAKETGELYYRLSVGFKNGVHYYGRLFATSEKRHPNSPDYFGFISLLPVSRQNQYSPEEWDAAPTLRIRGYRRRNASDNRARIQILGAPVKVGADELPL